MAYKIDGRVYPVKGEQVRHKHLGFIGEYVEDVFTNNNRRHWRVISNGKTYVLPDKDFEMVSPSESQ